MAFFWDRVHSFLLPRKKPKTVPTKAQLRAYKSLPVPTSNDQEDVDNGTLDSYEYDFSSVRRGNLIGNGPFGDIYNCLDDSTGSIFAMKTIKFEGSRSAHSHELAHIFRELDKLIGLEHDNLVTYYGFRFNDEDRCLEIVMDRHGDGKLSDRREIFNNGNISLLVKLLNQVVDGLMFLRENKLSHQNLKGNNILIGAECKPILTDYGLAGVMEIVKRVNKMSMPQKVAVIPFWTAPEVLLDQSLSTERSDIWSLGCLIIEALTGQPPWTGQPIASLQDLLQHMREKATPTIPNDCFVGCMDLLKNLAFKYVPAERETLDIVKEHPFMQNLNPEFDLTKSEKDIFTSALLEELHSSPPPSMNHHPISEKLKLPPKLNREVFELKDSLFTEILETSSVEMTDAKPKGKFTFNKCEEQDTPLTVVEEQSPTKSELNRTKEDLEEQLRKMVEACGLQEIEKSDDEEENKKEEEKQTRISIPSS